jgi:hypothetical protein
LRRCQLSGRKRKLVEVYASIPTRLRVAINTTTRPCHYVVLYSYCAVFNSLSVAMPFTSHTFEIAKGITGGVNPIIPVFSIPLTTPRSWKIAGLIRTGLRLIPQILLLGLFARICSRLLAVTLGLFRSPDEVSIILQRLSAREVILVCTPWFLSILHNHTNAYLQRASLSFFARVGVRSFWKVFWTLYFIFGDEQSFLDNYLEAWKQRCEAEQRVFLTSPTHPSALPSISRAQCSIIMFIDHRRPLHVPCRWDMTDKEFVTHISRLYHLRKVLEGFISLWSVRSLGLVEIVDVGNAKQS